ncbi:MAG: DEAD/DEAH box helicase, partial [Verrucomicrobiota bacterium]
ECEKGGCPHAPLSLCRILESTVEQLAARDSIKNTPAATVLEFKQPKRPFAREIAAKLQRGLLASEEAYADAVELLYQRHGASRMLAAPTLDPFLEGAGLPAWELVELWPRNPINNWEAWLYLAVFLRNRGVEWPSFLASITTLDSIERLAGDWERQQALRHWEEGLGKLLSEMETSRDRRSLEARVQIGATHAKLQWRRDVPEGEWYYPTEAQYDEAISYLDRGRLDCAASVRFLLESFSQFSITHPQVSYSREENCERLARILLHPVLAESVVNEYGAPFERPTERLRWRLRKDPLMPGSDGDYLLELTFADGERPAFPIFTAAAELNCYVTDTSIYNTGPLLRLDPRHAIRIPAAGLFSGRTVQLLQGLGADLPEEVQQRVLAIQPVVRLRCWLEERAGEERLHVCARALLGVHGERIYMEHGWQVTQQLPEEQRRILVVDDSVMRLVPKVLSDIGAKEFQARDESWGRLIGKRFAEEFSAWMDELPAGVEVDLEGDLDSLRNAVVSGAIRLDVTEASPDWFDLQVALSLSDTELTPEEVQLLLEAKGKFVRLKNKGWRRLEFEIDDEQAEQLAELGVNPFEIGAPAQRYHALQLAASPARTLLSGPARDGVLRRASEIQTSVKPAVPAGIRAEMRAYQIDGFHFLAYLSANRFGGILADDMGLGKTLQTLAWIAWLRELPDYDGKPILVICPKSVVQNWLCETERFLTGMTATIWRGGSARQLKQALSETHILVANYAQLRLSAELLAEVSWHVVVLDEAQYIKNPSSQTAAAASALRGEHRLALSGTPIENRLLDLWSLMHFSMPGLLGLRSQFQRQYDSRADVLARKRLSARIRPFILRRTKSEVAKDLPARIEEDLVVEMEGTQASLYSAELKRARQALLKIQTSRQLDKERFNVLTSLLRLRQICCHPGLVSSEHGHSDSAKMEALIDLLEPLMEQGNKVLVFSQFVDMLERVEREVDARGWDSFMLTGETENRGELVEEFQSHEGAATFLISLRAGGMGLNLTAASYVVLFDPWWNPAVENQAIDRTHRIGQTQQVIAYRLVAKGTVEEKIRQLQRSKSALAGDILGEESLGKALTLADFQFLLQE